MDQLRLARLAIAIARAEGFGIPDTAPTRNNNPGALVYQGSLETFMAVSSGWGALFNKLQFDLSGESKRYNPTMTVREFAWMWVNGTKPGEPLAHVSDTSESWAETVAEDLSIGVNWTLADYLDGLIPLK